MASLTFLDYFHCLPATIKEKPKGKYPKRNYYFFKCYSVIRGEG
jgi:hypothetical protein